MEQFIWQNKSWPHFFWNPQSIIYPLANLYKIQGLLEGQLKTSSSSVTKKIALDCFTSEILNSYKLNNIELDESALQGMIAKKLVLDKEVLKTPTSQLTHGEALKLETIVSVFFEIIENKNNPLTIEHLLTWNKQLSSISTTANSSSEEEKKLTNDNFRKEDFNYINGGKICYTAPNPKSLPSEIDTFIKWFNKSNCFQELDCILKSAITHFYFIALQPFEENSDILARMIAYSVLFQNNSVAKSCLFSISEQIMKNQKDYKYMLNQMATGNMDMTIWLAWSIKNLNQAVTTVLNNISNIHEHQKNKEKKEVKEKKLQSISQNDNKQNEIKPDKAKTEKLKTEAKTTVKAEVKSKTKNKSEKTVLNKRQQSALDYMKTDVTKKISTSEYSKLFNCSQDTASRDFEKLLSLDLIEKGTGGGRSTYYSIKQ